MWADLIRQVPGPRYRAIVQVISDAIRSGKLSARDQLPTHRELARQLDIDVGTASRAYSELRRRGLISGEVGRGTFVAETVRDAPPSISEAPSTGSFIDLSHNFPLNAPTSPLVARTIEELSRDCDIASLMTHQVDLGHAHHREAGRAWLDFNGLSDAGGEVAVTAGAQHGLLLAISALTTPGGRVMTEAFTYFGMKSVATMLGLELVAIDIDGEGLVPDSFENACRTSGAKVLYCTPTLHNPTTALMSEARREDIAKISRRYGIHIVEDDVYGFLLEPRVRPLCSQAPDLTFYVTSLSKCIGPGLRIGFLRFPASYREKVGLAIRATTLMASPLTAEIAARMIETGFLHCIAADQRAMMKQRQSTAELLLQGHHMQRHPQSFHVWLEMANGWTPQEFSLEAERLGVGVAPGDLFTVSPATRSRAVRLCISAANDASQLNSALSLLSGLLEKPRKASASLVA
ncbi:PLP-dependent aminotransferase family protein [Microvirga massiliensis]|uniref:aminotransferase-like domain-containing protein n=1 Tax=Microvirga massiliensis TaxID=1033741 RepID=UPI00062B72C9|nr:PLP-dependent aminotransferase family protein [Microvirga massiliensis]